VNEQLNGIRESLPFLLPEIALTIALIVTLCLGLFKASQRILLLTTIIALLVSAVFILQRDIDRSVPLLQGILYVDGLGNYLKILVSLAGIITCIMMLSTSLRHPSEFCSLLLTVTLGGFLLVMSHDFLMIFLSIEMISLSSYVLAGFSFTRKASEGSFKYFLFGSVASASMLYGMSFLYGITGSTNLSSAQFFDALAHSGAALTAMALFMVLAGLLYKITAAPMHPWAPDVYEAAPVPVIAFLSVAPKAAGFGVLIKFVLATNLHGLSEFHWQSVIAILAMLSIGIGNFSALKQNDPKRMMAYSSIAQTGFLLTGLATLDSQGIHFMLFYLGVYLIMNFVVFVYLQAFEKMGINRMSEYNGIGLFYPFPLVLLLVGFASLTGLPPTAGFTAKLLIFSSVWEAFTVTGDKILIVLLVFGLINTVVALFYYLRIPYFAFLKSRETPETQNIAVFENFLAAILVVLVLLFFFMPTLLMGWINKINFVV
jgi:NADH-quinone oxidoreductase subunit N